MCGICGFVFSDAARLAPPGVIDRMTDALAHRGPDDRGTFAEPGCALGHRRLSIIDLSPAGHQPMTNEDGSLQVVVDGRIYNCRDLRPGLEAAGRRLLGLKRSVAPERWWPQSGTLAEDTVKDVPG